MKRLIAVASLLIAAAPANLPVVIEGPATTAASPLLLNRIEDLRVVCGERKDVAMQLACVSWLNGAAQINARFRSLSPQIVPDYCPPPQGLPLGQQRDVLLAWLAAHPKQGLDPALIGFRKAMAAAFPCKAGA